MLSCKFTAYIQNTFSEEHLWMVASKNRKNSGHIRFAVYNEMKLLQPSGSRIEKKEILA